MKPFLILLLVISTSGYAQTNTETSPSKKTDGVESMVKEVKKDRKKKVEMCHDCGKPESQCDCEGEEHKKNH